MNALVAALEVPWEWAIMIMAVGLLLSIFKTTRKFGFGCLLMIVSVFALQPLWGVGFSLLPGWLGIPLCGMLVVGIMLSVVRLLFGKNVANNVTAIYVARGLDSLLLYSFRLVGGVGRSFFRGVSNVFKKGH